MLGAAWGAVPSSDDEPVTLVAEEEDVQDGLAQEWKVIAQRATADASGRRALSPSRRRGKQQARSPSPALRNQNTTRSGSGGGNGSRKWWGLMVLHYFAAYGVIGCALFSNYYPWT